MQSLAQKALLGNGMQIAAPRRHNTRKVVVVKAIAAPTSTTLNTQRSEEASFRCSHCRLCFVLDGLAIERLATIFSAAF